MTTKKKRKTLTPFNLEIIRYANSKTQGLFIDIHELDKHISNLIKAAPKGIGGCVTGENLHYIETLKVALATAASMSWLPASDLADIVNLPPRHTQDTVSSPFKAV